ncbi:hypothetical protein LN042_15110 [Kitasatospora sp. RB6PN24]|uniref:hypothetical protein n=1 Tax=Kitasatospora humi TaxID=2893891 RepID=UPI001E3C09C4|nr:hypothetical protein [Kitasatospora humi]MCC9308402.1 hypothetical protein [Kitasatospora humi]
MNTRPTGSTSLGLRLALRIYPAGYRAERGEEIATVHADVTAGAGRLATARETAGVAAYGLRVRTGLTASGTAGRLLATTAPPAAAMALGQQLPVLWQLPHYWRQTAADSSPDWHPVLIASAFPGALWLLVVAAALLRTWTAARILAALAGVAAIVRCLVFTQTLQTFVPGAAPDYVALIQTAGAGVLWSLLVFAAPGDLLGSTVVRQPLAAVPPALLLAAGTFLGSLNPFTGPGRTEAMLSGVCLPLGLLPLAFLARGRLLPAAIGLAVLPLALTLTVTNYRLFTWQAGEFGNLGVVACYLLGVSLLTLATAAAVRVSRAAPANPKSLGKPGTRPSAP